MIHFVNINRSGKAPASSGGSAIPGIMPASPSGVLLEGELLLMSSSGMAYTIEELIAMLSELGPMTSVMYGLLVTKVSESPDKINYDLGIQVIIDAISEPFLAEGVKTVTLRYKFPYTRALGGGAVGVWTHNAHCFDASVLHSRSAVFVPRMIEKDYSGNALTWTKSLPAADVNTYQHGSIEYSDGSGNRFAYPTFRTPIGSLVGDDMVPDRLDPQIEFTCAQLLPNYTKGYFRADLSFPVALSRDGADLYFMCYKSNPSKDDPSTPPILAFHFCKLGDVYTPVKTLADHFLLIVGPEAH